MVSEKFRELKGSKDYLFGANLTKKGFFLPISSPKIENPTWSRFLSANLGLAKFLVSLIWSLHHEDK